jgi:isoleucyl-tRNA synthetase
VSASEQAKRSDLVPARTVGPEQALPELEEQVLVRWRERDVFRESLRQRAGRERWVFYEGPPTANGPPGAHHVLSRVFKDIYPRYKTMRGYLVERKGGWDCHGLPVEIAVEQQLGITSKAQIEETVGIAEFNARCRESVFAYVQEWNRLTERIGFWLDLDDAYRTLDESYIESVWSALAALHASGLLYEAHKVVPYCYRCQTALSSHEVALGYEDVVDRSIYVRLPLNLGARIERDGVTFEPDDALLVWTTTPWTLPGNVAVAAGPQIEYVRARVPRSFGDAAGSVVILAAARVEAVLGGDAEVLGRFPGRVLIGERHGKVASGVSYAAPIFAMRDRPQGGAPVIAGDFVSTEEGTGLVHIAPAFGEDDRRVAAAAGLPGSGAAGPHDIYNPVRLEGTFDQRVFSPDGKRSYEGRKVKDERVTEDLIDDLRRADRLLAEQPYEHSYPHCWRCGTPLIYYAKTSWYVRTTARRDELLAANESVSWHPPHVKHGRFGEWLRGNVDWALSRERYWGTPLPIWRCPRGHIRVVGSFAELERDALSPLGERARADHHRPFVDDVELACAECDSAPGERPPAMRRVPEVIDVWFDSGAMPFAQYHALPGAQSAGAPGPLAQPVERFRERFPADFVCEALDQTRGWFYSLLAISTLLFGESPYRNVVCLGLILDAEGQKMSKSKGNAVEPWEVIARHGADAFRWYLFTAKAPWDGYRFSQHAIGEAVRLFFRPLWSTYYFYVLYAHANAGALESAWGDPGSDSAAAGAAAAERSPAADDAAQGEDGQRAQGEDARRDLDRWALSRTAATAELVAARLDAYDATSAGRAIAELLDDISNWYVRRSRRRFWDGDPSAFATLRTCLLLLARMLAPFCPFVADELYDNLDGTLPSVHLCEFPVAGALPARDTELEDSMAVARETVRLGLAARARARMKIRQPLGEALVVAGEGERPAIERLADVILEELNVKRIRFVEAADELGRYELKPDYRRLGPRFGAEMPLLADAIAALDPGHVASTLAEGGEVGVSVAGRDHTLGAQDLQMTLRAPEGFSVEREGTHAVALDLSIDDELRREGRSREIIHAVQNARRAAGLAVEDRIELRLSGAAELLDAARENRDFLAAETLAVVLRLDGQKPLVQGETGTGEARGGATPEPQGATHRARATIDGLELEIELSRRSRGIELSER